MDRRGFLRAFGIGGAGLAAGSAIIHATPAAKVNELKRGESVKEATPPPVDALAQIEELLGLAAMEAAVQIQGFMRGTVRSIAVHKTARVAISGDTVILPDGSQVRLAHHMESTFAIPDVIETLLLRENRLAYMGTACMALAEAISGHCEGQRSLVYARHPLPFKGCGAIAARCEAGTISARLILAYAPAALRHHITIDTLYGVA